MASISILFLFCATFLLSEEAVPENCRGAHCFPDRDWSVPCVGAHCQGLTDAAAVASRRTFHSSAQPRPVQFYPSFQHDAHISRFQGQSAPLAPYAVIQTQQAVVDGRRTNPKTITADVAHPACAGGTCPTGDSRQQTSDDTATRGCKGIGCQLPARTRHKPKPCVGNGCDAHAEEVGRGGTAPVQVRDRAAQFLSEFADFGSERGAWIQLTCDMKPGEQHRVRDLKWWFVNSHWFFVSRGQ